jgi:hypothetical protein
VRDRCHRLVAIDRYYAPRGIVLTGRLIHNCSYSFSVKINFPQWLTVAVGEDLFEDSEVQRRVQYHINLDWLAFFADADLLALMATAAAERFRDCRVQCVPSQDLKHGRGF